MARIEGNMSALAYLQLFGGALTVMVVPMSAAFRIVAAFRPERDPTMTQMLHDLGWLTIDQLYAARARSAAPFGLKPSSPLCAARQAASLGARIPATTSF
jgi:hypothetical protein